MGIPTRLLLALALALPVAGLLPASPSAADAVVCPCWPDGPPPQKPVVCHASPNPFTSFAYLFPPPTYLQVTSGWCRNGGLFRWVTPAQAQLCARQLSCLCDSANPGPVELCNGVDDNCNGQVDETFDLGASCLDGQGVCQAEGALVCDPIDATENLCDVLPRQPDELPETTCTGGLDEDCDGDVDCADADCSSDLACVAQTCGNAIIEGLEECDGGACCESDCTFSGPGVFCGDGGDVCDDATCDGAGTCVPGFNVDTVCDDTQDDACDVNPDTCNASGACVDDDPSEMAEVCTGGGDEDCDGDVDCDDLDCMSDPACGTGTGTGTGPG